MKRTRSQWKSIWDVNYTGNGDESLIDLDLRDVENYGTDSEVGKFLQNNEETQGCEELQNPTDVDVCKIFAKEQIVRGGKGEPRNFSQFRKKLTGAFKGRNNFRKMQTNVEKWEEGRNILRKNKPV